MVFSSIEFLFLFLPAFLICYALLPGKNITYIVFSLLFYFFGEGWFVLLIIAFAVMNFVFGLGLGTAQSDLKRRLILTAAVTSNLFVLGFFKYTAFFASALFPSDQIAWTKSIHMPLGISFFTFHSISYLVDVYRRTAKAEKSIVNLSLYLLMFPQLISGPILRFHTIAKQLQRRVITGRHVYYGLVLFAIGLGQKVIIADTMASVCDPLFAQPANLDTATAWLATITYTLQIYFDFAGYSNMAIGLGWLTGFYFPRNFNHPYVSKSITEFWRRWHMSLSRWFLDYLYIPLGGNKYGALKTYRNLVIVFLLCGLWHGAAWTFVIWGAYHGLLLVLERLGFDHLLRKSPKVIQHLYTMVAVMFGWVLFRADSVTDAWLIMGKMITLSHSAEVSFYQSLNLPACLTLILGILFSTRLVPNFVRNPAIVPDLPPWPKRLAVSSYAIGSIIFLMIAIFSCVRILSGSYSPFIYFRF